MFKFICSHCHRELPKPAIDATTVCLNCHEIHDYAEYIEEEAVYNFRVAYEESIANPISTLPISNLFTSASNLVVTSLVIEGKTLDAPELFNMLKVYYSNKELSSECIRSLYTLSNANQSVFSVRVIDAPTINVGELIMYALDYTYAEGKARGFNFYHTVTAIE